MASPTLGKRPRPPPPSSFPLSKLPDQVLIRIIRFLSTPNSRCHPPRPLIPCHPKRASNLALCSSRLLRLFKHAFFSAIDAVPDRDFLSPLPRSDARFHTRDPRNLRALAKLAGPALVELHLPLYDCSMEDAQWSILAEVAAHRPELRVLSFVDSGCHICTTPPQAQCKIFATLLPSITRLSVYVVREERKLYTMAELTTFQPSVLVLHQIHPKLKAAVLQVLKSRGAHVKALTLSFEQVQHEYNMTHTFLPTFLACLSDVVRDYMHSLKELSVMNGPRQNPLTALRGPVLSCEESRREFETVIKAVKEAKRGGVLCKGGGEGRGLKLLVLERVIRDVSKAVGLFAKHCDKATCVEVCLNEVLLVSPPVCKGEEEQKMPYFRATKLHSSSWMIKELPGNFFRRIEHIHVGLDEDCLKGSRPWYDRLFIKNGGCVNPDMQSFRFLCERSGAKVESVSAGVPIESMEKANRVLQILSSGFAYARNVTTLELSGDVLKYVGLDHKLLYSVVGQLKNLRHMCVSEPTCAQYRKAQIENLPVLVRGLWMFCHRLESFKFEFSSFGNECSAQALRDGLESLREFDEKLPGANTHNLKELLEVALRHWAEEATGTY